MPRTKTLSRVRKIKAQGKALATEAGELMREEMQQIRAGKPVAPARKAIAIALAKARRAGVPLPLPKKAVRGRKVARGRARKAGVALKHEGKLGTTTVVVGRQVRTAAVRRGLKGRPLAKKAIAKRMVAKKLARGRRARAM